MNNKMTTNSQLSTTDPKKQKQTKETTTRTESQKSDHMEGYKQGGGGSMGGKRYME